MLRPVGPPLTVGLSGLGIASLVESGLGLGWIASSQAREVGVILIAVPFVLQLPACVFCYLARDGATGAAVGVLSTTWLGIGLLHLIAGGKGRGGALGLLLLGGALGLLLLAAGFALTVSASSVSRATGSRGSSSYWRRCGSRSRVSTTSAGRTRGATSRRSWDWW